VTADVVAVSYLDWGHMVSLVYIRERFVLNGSSYVDDCSVFRQRFARGFEVAGERLASHEFEIR